MNPETEKPIIALDSGKVLIAFDYANLINYLSRLRGREIDSERLSQMKELVSLMQIGQMRWHRVVAKLNLCMGTTLSETKWRNLYTGALQHEIPGMHETLKELKKNYQLMALSNTDEIHWSYLLKHFPIYKLLDGWVLSHEEKMAKPDPAIYQLFMKRYCNNGVPAFFTDDMPENVATARELGWRAEIFVDSAHFVEQIKCIHP